MKKLFLIGMILGSVAQATSSISSSGSKKRDLVQSIEAVLERGRHDMQIVQAGSGDSMVRAYIEHKYQDDRNVFKNYRFVSNANDTVVDQEVAGTLDRARVLPIVEDSLSRWSQATGSDLSSKSLPMFSSLLKMKNLEFGFDGFEQNGCAAPTEFLLILDKSTGEVDGIDLNPCEE